MLLWTAEVAALLDLRFMTPEVAARLTDKYLQREALRAAVACPFPASGRFLALETSRRGARSSNRRSFPPC